jgi:hypothetical protein
MPPYSSDVRFTLFGNFSSPHQPCPAEKTSSRGVPRAFEYSIVKEPVSFEVYTREVAMVTSRGAKTFRLSAK